MPLAPQTRLGPYEIVAPIGAGGTGEVYKTRDTRLDRTVAIKVSNGEFSERFEREARAAAALNHPNICQIYDVGPNYIVMEFIGGAPLCSVDSARQLLDLAVQIADGMAAAHAAGFVHRETVRAIFPRARVSHKDEGDRQYRRPMPDPAERTSPEISVDHNGCDGLSGLPPGTPRRDRADPPVAAGTLLVSCDTFVKPATLNTIHQGYRVNYE